MLFQRTEAVSGRTRAGDIQSHSQAVHSPALCVYPLCSNYKLYRAAQLNAVGIRRLVCGRDGGETDACAACAPGAPYCECFYPTYNIINACGDGTVPSPVAEGAGVEVSWHSGECRRVHRPD